MNAEEAELQRHRQWLWHAGVLALSAIAPWAGCFWAFIPLYVALNIAWDAL